ncbi:MAG: hypothetical protein EOO28_01430 [Comamonadaceae bacterium]|nr:MAG: hypothetical protein EOO28_01430 [Comamonadaceae bacterium]
MGIIGFSQSPVLSVLLAPLQAVVTFFAPWRREGGVACDASAALSRIHLSSARTTRNHVLAGGCPARPAQTGAASISKLPCNGATSRNVRVPRLRVVRELDAGVASSCAGRMVISGRMADVCAELDRMAQREAASC